MKWVIIEKLQTSDFKLLYYHFFHLFSNFSVVWQKSLYFCPKFFGMIFVFEVTYFVDNYVSDIFCRQV